MKRTWSPNALAAHWTFADAERPLPPDHVDHLWKAGQRQAGLVATSSRAG